KKMKVWKIKNVEGEYKNIMYSSLNTYKPSERFSMFVMKRLLKTIYIAIKYWIVAYFVTGLLYLFEQSNIPVLYNILVIEICTDVNEFEVYVIVFSIYIISILLKLISNKNKRKDRKFKYTILLSEKHRQAKKYRAALSKNAKNKNGYIEINDSKYFPNGLAITWAVGHLFRLKKPYEYDMKYKRFEMDNLYISQNHEYVLDNSKQDRFEVIKTLVSKADNIIIGTDPD